MAPKHRIPAAVVRTLRRCFNDIRWCDREAGYSTETVLVTALLVTTALTVVGIIAAKVIAKARGIDLG